MQHIQMQRDSRNLEGQWMAGMWQQLFPSENQSVANSTIDNLMYASILMPIKMFFINGGVNQHYKLMTDKVIVITGANAGIGYECALELARLKPKAIVMACRNNRRANEAIANIKLAGYFACEFMQLDLNDLQSVESFAKEVSAKYPVIDILLNNAGIMALQTKETTLQGFEKQIGVNHFGHFLLTNLLMKNIEKAEEGRIINVSSRAHQRGKMTFEDLQWESRDYSSIKAYEQSKLANVYFTRHLSTMLPTNVKTVSLHPGVVRTELARYIFDFYPWLQFLANWILFPILWFFTKSSSQGAQTSLHCCLSPFDKLESGAYYSDCVVKKETFPNAQWEAEAKKLWEVSEQAVEKYIKK